MSEELRQIIVGYGDDPSEWRIGDDDEAVNKRTEPEWAIIRGSCGGFRICRENGRYTQECDADSVEEAVKLMRAMDAAEEALNAALRIEP